MSAAGTTTDQSLAAAAKPISHRRRSEVVRAQLFRYLEVVRWIAVDSMWRYRYRTGLTVGLGLLGMSLQVGALGLALHYAKLLEHGAAYHVFGRKFMPQSSRALLVGFASLILLGLLSSSALTLISRLKALRLRRNYEEFCCGRALRLAAAQVGCADAEEPHHGDQMLMSIARRESRQCGRVYILLITLVVPMVTTIAALITLFLQNWLLSAIVLGFTAIAGVFLYRTNRRGANSSRRMEKQAPLAGLEMRQVNAWIRATSRRLLPGETWFDQELFGNSHVREFFDAYEDRITAGDRADFVSNLLLASAVFAIMITFGMVILQDHAGWSRLIVYLIALRYALVNFSHVNRRLVGVSRLYPHIRRYSRFVRANSKPGPTPRDIGATKAWPILSPSGQKFSIQRGQRLGVAGDVGLSRFSLPQLLESLVGNTGKSQSIAANASIVSPEIGLLPGHPLWESLGFVAPPASPVSNRLRALGVDLSQTPDLDVMMGSSTIDSETWRRFDDSTLTALLILAAVDSTSAWIFVDTRALAALNDGLAAALLDQLNDRVVVLVHGHRMQQLAKSGENWIVVLAGNEIRWSGTPDQYRQQLEHVKSLIPRAQVHRGSPMNVDLDEEDDDDDAGDGL